MNITNNTRDFVLTPPMIREADDGGLGYSDIIENPWGHLNAQIVDWGRLVSGDVIDVLWGPNLHPIARHVYRNEDDQAPIIKIDVTMIRQFGEGSMQCAARLTDVDTGNIKQSEPTTVRVKYAIPGGLDPDPNTPYLNELLDKPAIEPLPMPDDFNGVVVVVPPYLNMAAGDSLTVSWHGLAVSRPSLAESEVGHPVRIAIDRDTVLSASGQAAIVRYQVYDVVGNWSRWSVHVEVEVPSDDSSAPTAPWVVGTVNDLGATIDASAIGSNDLVVRVENNPAPVGSMVAAVWDGVTATGKALTYRSPDQKVHRPGQVLDFSIPNRQVTELAGGEGAASYVFTSNGVATHSRRRRLAVLGKPQELQAPTVREAKGLIIAPSDLSTVVHVEVAGWPGLRDDDRCYLEWVGQRKDGQPTFFNAALTGANVGPDNRLVFEVPAEEVVRLAGGKLRVRYSVAVHTQVRSEHGLRSEPLVHISSPWLELAVEAQVAPLSIDSSPAALASLIVRLEKRVTVPPAGAFVARVASGGVPPYRYSASSGAVEVDAATGRVVSLRNGNAIVTATDAKGATVSYPVKVSNVLHLTDLVVQTTYALGNGQARKRGGRQPSLAEWDAMRAAYGGAPDVRADAAWSSHQIDKFDNYVVYPNTGAREARKAFGLGNPLGVAWVWCVTAPTV
ncbi:hypothetical protein L2Y96_09975 [Luteibacter aegosomaticola]|uniref:hypothetical protein n=1 Tax=Luteibacter aegosomaticola TaxID=2911538 RepID=UPI001FFBB128|nr:hypothetical protein [Luteibacter aegosomaticola]UPG92068.1 hypothetical protein L2Y96_09975 [Luteibacter aegosomaticola]